MRARLNPDPTNEVARRILDAAIDVVTTQGEAELRIHDVTEVAGVQAPMIYRHFGNREGLVQSAILASFTANLAEMAENIAASVGSASSAEEFRRDFATALRNSGDPGRAGFRSRRLLVLGSAVNRADVTKIIRTTQKAAFEPLVETFASARERGWIRPEIDPAEFVSWLTNATVSLAVSEHFGSIPEPGTWWIQLQTEACLAVLFGEVPDATQGI